MSSMFPNPRRIVTGHNAQSQAIVVADSTIPTEPTGAKCDFEVLYETDHFPASNGDWVDLATERTTDLFNKQGVVLRVVDFAPNIATADIDSRLPQIVHQTKSLDFSILHSGKITR